MLFDFLLEKYYNLFKIRVLFFILKLPKPQSRGILVPFENIQFWWTKRGVTQDLCFSLHSTNLVS